MSYISTIAFQSKSFKYSTFSTHSSFPVPQVSWVLIFFILSNSIIQILMDNNQDHTLCFKSNCNSTLKSMVYRHLLCNQPFSQLLYICRLSSFALKEISQLQASILDQSLPAQILFIICEDRIAVPYVSLLFIYICAKFAPFCSLPNLKRFLYSY